MSRKKLHCCSATTTTANLHVLSPGAWAILLPSSLDERVTWIQDESFWFILSNDLIFEALRDRRTRENTDPTKCNFFTLPVTSTCFVNLVLTLPPWGLNMETWCVAAPTPVALTAEACKSSLHISYNKISSKFRRLGVRRKQFRVYLS